MIMIIMIIILSLLNNYSISVHLQEKVIVKAIVQIERSLKGLVQSYGKCNN